MKVNFTAESASFEAEFNDSAAAKAIVDALPIESRANTWGDEIYFDIGLACPHGGETLDLEVGDVGYWPRGRCLCVFFGPTPASDGERPVPASPVVVVGRTTAKPAHLRKVSDGEKITVSSA